MKKKKIKKKLQQANNKPKPAIFLDRDGTINYDYGYVYKFSEFKFRPYVIKGLRYLSRKKYFIFIITNQAGIAKGKFRLLDLLKLHNQLKKYLKKRNITINDIKFCPYHPNAKIKIYKRKTGYRKPGNLMIKEILKKWNVDIKKSFMIGDKKTDKIAAKKSKIYYEYVSGNFFNQVKRIEKKIINNN